MTENSRAVFTPQDRPFPIAKWVSRLLFLALVVGSAWNALTPFRRGPWLIFEEDDFFYYLRVAVNIAAGRGSTFNGIVKTNGYHPLWLAVLAVVSRISADPRIMAGFLALVIFISTIVTFLLARKLLRRQIDDPLLTSALAIIVAFYALPLFDTGMEVILAIPFLFGVAVLYQDDRIWSRRAFSFGFGLLLALTILSRLDVMIFAGLLALLTCSDRGVRTKLSSTSLLFMALGLSPFLLYLVFNQVEFHTWLPISGMAKQLKVGYSPSLVPWKSLLRNKAYALVLVAVCLPLSFMPKIRSLLTPSQRVLFSSILAFPWIYVLILSLRSDWRLWAWYFYSLRIALCISFCMLLAIPVFRGWARKPIVTGLAVLAAFGVIATAKRKPIQQVPEIYAAAQELVAFSATHPGVYAMGDRSGLPGYLLSDPVVQTEGLVMDKGFLTLIRNQVPLGEALAKYNVSYYVASTDHRVDGCFEAVEPAQAGKDSPHMRAEICEKPLAVFENHGLSMDKPENWTYIFKVPFSSAR